MLRCFFFFSSRRRHTRFDCDWSSDVCSSDLAFSVACASLCDNVVTSGTTEVVGPFDTMTVIVEPGGCSVDRKSTRLNSSHSQISYAVFCLKKKKKNIELMP